MQPRSPLKIASPLPLSRTRKTARTALPVAPFSLLSKHILTGEEMSFQEVQTLLNLASALKQERHAGIFRPLLPNRQLALYFEKPSLRTRVSFTAAMQDVGGNAIEIVVENTKGEGPEDTARVLSGFCHGIMARTFSHETIERMAAVSKASVINGLSDLHHPCQALADVLTLKETFGSLQGLKVAYVGDGNNVLHSLLLFVPFLGGELHYACPQGYQPNKEILWSAQVRAKAFGGTIVACPTPADAVRGAQAIYTDVWTSMGFEEEKLAREKAFEGYQVNEKLYALADKNAAIMHCLPMVRGQEIAEGMPEHPNSVIFQQSENRLHAQKALLIGLLS
ncbi:MAG: ornithine carbamoyltransferase [Bdellovibrionales bacterium]|nr:ornithine carbamoyltransferase [Bdellovibrionales bacterium]